MPSAQALRILEASYQLGDGRHVFYDDGRSTARHAADLYAVLPETTPGGSPNLENLQARHLLDRLQTGMGLAETHISTLRDLLRKHKPAIEQLRKSRDRQGQDPLKLGDAGPQARIMQPDEEL